MVGKPGGQPPPSAAKAFNAATSGKPLNAAAPAKTTTKAATMSPAPGGMSGGWSPPLGAKVAADRQKFAQQLSDAKAQGASAAKPKAEKPKTTSQAFNSAAPKGQTRAAFNAAAKSGGKGGHSR